MSPRSLALIILRCFGLYLLVVGLSGLSGALQSLGMTGESTGFPEPREVFMWQAVPAAISLGLGVLLTVNTDFVLRWLFQDLEESPELPGTPFAYQAIGFSLLGAWVLSGAIPAFVSRVVVLLFLARGSKRLELAEWWSTNWVDSVYVLLELGVGIALFRGSRRLAAWWFKNQPIRSEKVGRDRQSS